MDDLQRILWRDMALYRALPVDIRGEIDKFVPLFLKGKQFEGKNGLTVTDRHRFLIAANAALVGAAQRVSCFASVKWVLVYPNIVHIDGEAFHVSKVVLSWECVEAESGQPEDAGSNLVVHEFAHVLDHLLGVSHGTAAMRQAFEDVERRLLGDGESLFREEDIENPQEFFASASEVFFTRPGWLAEHYPALYGDLHSIYGLDMALYLQ